MTKIPSSILKQAFETNDTATIVNALQYHVLKGTRPVSSLEEGITQEWESLSTDPRFTTVQGGQRVTTYRTASNEVTFITGLGTRCTLLTAVYSTDYMARNMTDLLQDLTFGGGIVQIIDSPLTPPQDIVPTTSQYSLTSFQGALFAAKRTEALTAAKGITIFVPNNDAFKALGSAITQITLEELSSVISYHVLANETIYSSELRNASTLTTAYGGQLTVLEYGNKLFINTAQITEKDILIKNGVIHAIDTVLNPSQKGPSPNPEVATQSAVWASAVSADSVPFTSAIPCSTACQPTGTAASGGGGKWNAVRTTSSQGFAPMETGFGGRAMGVAFAVVGGVGLLV